MAWGVKGSQCPCQEQEGRQRGECERVSPMKQWSAVRRYFFPKGALTIVPAHSHTML